MEERNFRCADYDDGAVGLKPGAACLGTYVGVGRRVPNCTMHIYPRSNMAFKSISNYNFWSDDGETIY